MIIKNRTKKNIKDLTVALAAALQAARCIDDLASKGFTDEKAFNTLLHSLCQIDANDTISIYGGVEQLEYGLKGLKNLLARKKSDNVNLHIQRYFFSLFLLERKLAHNKKTMHDLSKRVRQTVMQANFFSPYHPVVVKSFADCYLQTISTFRYRLHIIGKPEILQNPVVFEKIRALLLAGVRALVLWRQLGGSRWDLFINNQKIQKAINSMLHNTESALY